MIAALLLATLTATYTVTTAKTVEAGGDVPVGAEATFVATQGRGGQMTTGKSATLSLTGWDDYTIHSVTLSMHSNKTSGAGELAMTIGEQCVWEIADAPFESTAWYGAWSQAWVDISKSIGRQVGTQEPVVIRITASENSLYVQRYTVEYSLSAQRPYRVALVTGLGGVEETLKERSRGEGVVLPLLRDTLNYSFAGWTEEELQGIQTECPALLPAGERYYPAADCTLWAVWADKTTVPTQVTDYDSGEYVVAHHNTYWEGHILTGSVHNKILAAQTGTKGYVIELDTAVFDRLDSKAWELTSAIRSEYGYTIDFLTDSTLRITHTNENAPIGYKNQDLAEKACDWRYTVLQDSTLLLWYTYKEKYYYLTVAYGKMAVSDKLVAYVQQVSSLPQTGGLRLFPLLERKYTGSPLQQADVPTTTPIDRSTDVIVQFGIYKLHIKDGKKRIYLEK